MMKYLWPDVFAVVEKMGDNFAYATVIALETNVASWLYGKGLNRRIKKQCSIVVM